MEIKRIAAVFWSPTGGTRRVVESAAEAAALRLEIPVETIDITPPTAREQTYSFIESDLVFFGVPTYAGKVPNKLLPFLQSGIHGNGAAAVGVVTFGNRSFDNALAEVCAVLEGDDFRTIAGGAFVCRHAFTDRLAYGRPGQSDLFAAKRFGEDSAAKAGTMLLPAAPVRVPGDAAAPYYIPKGIDGQPAKFLKAKPKTDLSRCSGCGVCARACPMGAIDPAEISSVPGTCIKCQACVRKCTRGVKYFDDESFLSHVAMLEANFTEAKTNEVFL